MITIRFCTPPPVLPSPEVLELAWYAYHGTLFVDGYAMEFTHADLASPRLLTLESLDWPKSASPLLASLSGRCIRLEATWRLPCLFRVNRCTWRACNNGAAEANTYFDVAFTGRVALR